MKDSHSCLCLRSKSEKQGPTEKDICQHKSKWPPDMATKRRNIFRVRRCRTNTRAALAIRGNGQLREMTENISFVVLVVQTRTTLEDDAAALVRL